MYKLFSLLGLCILNLTLVAQASAREIDPTKPLSDYQLIENKLVGKKSLVLDAIIHGDKIHTALINNTALQVGDSYGEYTLVAVNDDSVLLRTDDETIKLYIFSGVIAK